MLDARSICDMAMRTKFLQLTTGTRFFFEGQAYLKTTPMMARNEATGQERFILRSAMVDTADGVSPPPETATPTLQPAAVQKAWQEFCDRCDAALDALDPPVDASRLEALRKELLSARNEFENRAGLRSS